MGKTGRKAGQEYDRYIEVSESGTRKNLPHLGPLLPQMDGRRIADIGCGVGLLLEGYAKNNYTLGLDSNKKSLQSAKRRGIHVKLHDLEKPLPIPSNSFDLVICKDVLEFIFNAGQLLSEMARIARPGGQVLLQVSNPFTVRELLSYALGAGLLKKRWYADSTELTNPHVRFFTRKNLINSLEGKGLYVAKDYSSMWGFIIPGTGAMVPLLSGISPEFFSPGITLLCVKRG